jgi:hypothetical protein
MNLRRWILAATAAGASMAPALHAAQVQVTTGVEYSRGDYGELTATEALVVPFSARMSFGGFSVRASIPFLTVHGPADIAPVVDDDGGDRGSNSGPGGSGSGSSGNGGSHGGGGGGGKGGGSEGGSGSGSDDTFADSRDVHGMGDATLSLAWGLRDIGGTRLYADFTGRVRLPTGDEARGLGRGVTDYTALTEIGLDGDRGGLFVMGGRQFLESHATAPRRDVWQASGGGWMNIGTRALVGAQGNWRQAVTAGGTGPASVDVFVNMPLTRAWRVEISGSAGLNKSSADYAAGIGLTWKSSPR